MKVFIAHGHNEVVKLKIKDFIATRLSHEPVILGEQPGRHKLTIIEALEKFSEGCEFAVILLTGDDITKDSKRARQNVVHEAGFFQGRLGRSKVVLIVEKGVEIPSNLSGIFYLEYEKEIKELFSDLQIILDKGDASASAKKLDMNSLKKFVDDISSVDQSWARSIAEELQPYVDLPPGTFFEVCRPILHKHGDGYARQAGQFSRDIGKRNEKTMPGDGEDSNMKGFDAMINFASVMLIGPSERLANLCHNAVTIIDKAGDQPEDQDQAKTVVLRMFGLVE